MWFSWPRARMSMFHAARASSRYEAGEREIPGRGTTNDRGEGGGRRGGTKTRKKEKGQHLFTPVPAGQPNTVDYV